MRSLRRQDGASSEIAKEELSKIVTGKNSKSKEISNLSLARINEIDSILVPFFKKYNWNIDDGIEALRSLIDSHLEKK